MSELYIGLMSGTSLDGVDAVLVDFAQHPPAVRGHCSAPLASTLKAELLALNTPTENELHRAALAANQLVRLYAEQVHAVLAQCGVASTAVRAIGAHGQTVRHRPLEFDGTGYSLQLNNPALLAELCGIDVVADFRSRDLAAGGQGAPLVPPFHKAFFGQSDKAVAVLNIGGISNITLLDPAGSTLLGFDCGPGNALMDGWCQRHTGQPFDDAGSWAAQGVVDAHLLARLLDEPYFSKAPPKSTGRDLFSMAWLAGKLAPFAEQRPVDVQNTLAEFTARACIAGASSYLNNSKELIVCGGGAFNLYLQQRLQAGLPSLKVVSSDVHGLPPLQVEAAAFAWLARQTVKRLPGNLPSVTGASGLRVLGAIYPA